MKNTIPLLLLFVVELNAQQVQFTFREPLKVVAAEKINSNLRAGSTLYVSAIGYEPGETRAILTLFTKDQSGKAEELNASKIQDFLFDEIDNPDKVWNMYLLAHEAYESILKKGFQYGLRRELNDEAIDYVGVLSDRFFEDAFLEDYLYTLLTRIHPGTLVDRRPGNLYIKVIMDPEPNAFVLPNGCIIITTGLLSTIQSEDELVGVLAHEVAHFVLDHFVMNYNAEIDRRKKAEFWAGFATALAAGADIYAASRNKYYVPGQLTYSTAVIASAIAEDALARLGTRYNQEQEIAADNASKHILRVLHYDTLGLSAALQRIRDYDVLNGNYFALSGSGTHPSINSRITSLGRPQSLQHFIQPSYLKKLSSVNSFSARVELLYAHHESALLLVDRNISNGVAIESDLIVKAIILRRKSNSKESNEEVLGLLLKAKNLNVTPLLGVHKEEGITWIRLGNKGEAKKAFHSYLTGLEETKAKLEAKGYPNNNVEGITQEITWTKQMIYKVDSF